MLLLKPPALHPVGPTAAPPATTLTSYRGRRLVSSGQTVERQTGSGAAKEAGVTPTGGWGGRGLPSTPHPSTAALREGWRSLELGSQSREELRSADQPGEATWILVLTAGCGRRAEATCSTSSYHLSGADQGNQPGPKGSWRPHPSITGVGVGVRAWGRSTVTRWKAGSSSECFLASSTDSRAYLPCL